MKVWNMRWQVIGWLALLVSTSTVFAYTPADLLDVPAPNQTQLDAQAQQAELDLQVARIGVYGTANLHPSYTFEFPDNADMTTQALLTGSAELGYRYDAETMLVRQYNLERIVEARAAARRLAVWSALTTANNILRGQIAVQRSQDSLAAAQDRLSRMQQNEAAGQATPNDVRAAQLDVQDAQLNLEDAQTGLQGDRAAARNLGITGEPEFSRVTFTLPEPDAAASSRFRQLQLQLQLAHVRTLGDSVFNVLRDVTLAGGYEGNDANLYGEISLDQGRPGADVLAEFIEPTNTDQWVVRISAYIYVNESIIGNINRTRVNVTSAEADLADYRAQFALDAASRRAQVEYRNSQLGVDLQRATLAADALAGARSAVAQLQKQIAAKEQDVAAAEGDAKTQAQQDLDGLRNALQKAQQDEARSAGEAPRAQDSALVSWNLYLNAVRSYLDLVSGAWTIAGGA